MSDEEVPLSKQDQLALAIAQGKSVHWWARQNDVPRTTAYRWANDPDLRRQVEDWRRRSLDRALGWMAGHSMRTVKRITRLGETAESESVQLGALRALLSQQIALSNHANLEHRMAEIEEELRARNGNAAHPG
ncbi:MAG: hypothetical protein ACHRXM_40190 [Isosphaerales bacterium]